jgi:hypothetical protein
MHMESSQTSKIYKVGTLGGGWWAWAFLLVGFVLGQRLPDTFLTHPVATLQLIRTLPLGSRVIPVEDRQLQYQAPQAAWGEYSVVVGYEAIKDLHNKTILLCRIRTFQGSGPLLAINPSWITRAAKSGTS